MGGVLSYRLKLVRDQTPNKSTLHGNITCFSYKSLERATNNFRDRVRDGEFSSSSYKGKLEDGSNVIVKVYTNMYIRVFSMYGGLTSKLKIMSEVRHQNLVQLIGYCIEDDHSMLVHDFVGDYSLDELLFSNSIVKLDWRKRVFICRRIARGLEYLHFGANPPVVHRDVKPSSIFVDSSFNPKIADFELSCYLQDNDGRQPILGPRSRGYYDPEYLETNHYSEKTDVYAFGITLLEIISGKKIFHNGRDLKKWAWKLRESGKIPEIVDPNLAEFSEEEVIRFTNVALACVQSPLDLRPTMSEVRLMLSDNYEISSISLARPRSHIQQSFSDKMLVSS